MEARWFWFMITSSAKGERSRGMNVSKPGGAFWCKTNKEQTNDCLPSARRDEVETSVIRLSLNSRFGRRLVTPVSDPQLWPSGTPHRAVLANAFPAHQQYSDTILSLSMKNIHSQWNTPICSTFYCLFAASTSSWVLILYFAFQAAVSFCLTSNRSLTLLTNSSNYLLFVVMLLFGMWIIVVTENVC